MKLSAVIFALVLSACGVSENQVREAVKKNPKIVFDTFEDNPEMFMLAVNHAAEKARRAEGEKQVAAMKLEEENDLKNPKTPKLESSRRLTGTDAGKIVVVEYADFQCPACKMAYDSLRQFKEKHKDQVQFYFKNMPLDFHKMAYPAALYFEAIKKQDRVKAEKFFDYVFQNQREMTDDSFLKKVAADLGADTKKIEAEIKSGDLKKLITEDMNEFQSFGFTGTPTIILNGVTLSGAQRLEELERVAGLTLAKK